jgi:type IV pilus assembly protein PilM
VNRPALKLRRPASRRRLVGLDIEPGAIRAVQARAEEGRLLVESAASAVLDPGVVRDGEVMDPDALASALAGLFAEHRLDRSVRIGIANQRIVVRHMLLPPIADSREMATAVRFMAAEELPMPIGEAVLDHHLLGTAETPEGPRARVLVVAARRSMIETLLSTVRAAGLRPQGVDLSAFAMVRAHSGDVRGTVLHLAIGGMVNLAVTHDGECVFTRVIGGGMEAMATEVAERTGASIVEARAALLAVRLAPPAATREPEEGEVPEVSDEPPAPSGSDLDRLAATVLQDGLRRVVGEVRNSLDFHLSAQPALQTGSTEDTPGVERVMLTGTAVAVEGLADELGRMLRLPVEAGGVDGVDAADRGRFAVAAGLCVEEAPR